jgi:hypothetical protein
MEFENWIKKEMINTIIHVLLEMTGYLVCSVKKTARNVTSIARAECLRLPDSVP